MTILLVFLYIDRIHSIIVPGTSQSIPFKIFFFPMTKQLGSFVDKHAICIVFSSPLLITLFSSENILPSIPYSFHPFEDYLINPYRRGAFCF